MRIALAVPGLLPDRQFVNTAAGGRRLPGLETLLARGADLPPSKARSLSSWLRGNAALAPLRLAAAGLPASNAFWLCADPVHLASREGRLFVVDARAFPIAREESESLVASLNTHLARSGMSIVATQAAHWHLRLPSAPDVVTTPLDEAAGRSAEDRLPRGPGALPMHRLMNEIQMLLHAHPVNEARAERGLWPVNSVWLWGEGEGAPALPEWDVVYSDDATAQAFAISGTGRRALPQDLTPVLAEDADRALVVLDALDAPASYADAHTWWETLNELETRWFRPLVRAVFDGGTREVELNIIGAMPRRTLLRSADRLRLWRRPRPLASFLSADP